MSSGMDEEKNTIREYERTHPHISFEFSFDKLTQRHRELMVRAYSMCEELKRYLPFVGFEVYQDLMRTYISRGIQATTAIEGSNLTYEEVRELVYGEPKASTEVSSGSTLEKEEHRQMVRNMAEVYGQIRQEGSDFSVQRLFEINKLILKDLKIDERAVPGEIRTISVRMGRDTGAPAGECKFLLEKLFKWLGSEHFLSSENNSVDNFEKFVIKAILAHLYVIHIHPFGDGNGRASRAIEVQVLASAGIPGPSVHLLSNHYNESRNTYYNQLHESTQSKDGNPPEPYEFILYALSGFVEGLEEQVKLVAGELAEINQQRNWKAVVEEAYSDANSPTSHRQRQIALALPLDKSTPILEIRFLTPTITRMYGILTDKTVTRDVSVLLRKELVIKSNSDIQPNLELLRNEL